MDAGPWLCAAGSEHGAAGGAIGRVRSAETAADDTAASAAIDSPRLPQCSDPDDQKFIELAAACKADALLSKDKQVLKLARKLKKLALYRILSPEQWTAEWQAGGA